MYLPHRSQREQSQFSKFRNMGKESPGMDPGLSGLTQGVDLPGCPEYEWNPCCNLESLEIPFLLLTLMSFLSSVVVLPSAYGLAKTGYTARPKFQIFSLLGVKKYCGLGLEIF